MIQINYLRTPVFSTGLPAIRVVRLLFCSLAMLLIASCSGEDNRELVYVYQFSRFSCSESPESISEKEDFLVSNNIKTYSSKCVITDDASALPVCSENYEASSIVSSGSTINFSNSSYSDIYGDEPIELDASELDYTITAPVEGSQESGFAGGFLPSLPGDVGARVKAKLIAFAYNIDNSDLEAAIELNLKPVDTLKGDVEFVECE